MEQIIFPNIFPVACHTKNVGIGTAFVAINGTKEDGAKYILEAISLGATKIVLDKKTVLEKQVLDLIDEKCIELIRVDNTRESLALLSAKALNSPVNNLKIIAITGTKGKSTTTFLINHILKAAGYRTAILSTVQNQILNVNIDRSLTTEQPDYLNVFFDLCNKSSVDYVVMEVAAQAFSLHRVDGINFDFGIFTNFELEHGEFYPTIDEYFLAKLELFNHIKPNGKVFVNYDLKDKLSKYKINTFGLSKNADICGDILSNNILGLECLISNKYLFRSPSLLGEFNAYNIMAAYSIVSEIGIETPVMQSAVENFQGVPGRLNFKKLPNGARAVIDYAHNPSSFEAVLSTLKNLDKNNNLIVIFGAGGSRDKTKRPIMGSIASKYADTIILTSDNPRFEKISDIIEDIKAGISNNCNVIIESDREIAINIGYSLSNANSIIVLLGKGPDEYQIIEGVKSYFSESEILSNL